MTTNQPADDRPRIAWVTGSSSGIGRAIAEKLALDFPAIVVHGCRNRPGAEEVAAQIRRLGSEALIVMADLSDPGERNRAIDEVVAWRGVPHVLVNNAGLDVLTGEARNWSFEEKLDRLWATDEMGTISLSRAVGDRMRTLQTQVRTVQPDVLSPYSIVNVGWDQVAVGMEGDSGEMFATIKGAIMAFTLSFAKSLSPDVRVNCVAPGWIRTKWGDSADSFWNQRAQRESLLGRWGNATDVAHVVRFLVSDSASFVNGQVVPINGGFAGALPENRSSFSEKSAE